MSADGKEAHWYPIGYGTLPHAGPKKWSFNISEGACHRVCKHMHEGKARHMPMQLISGPVVLQYSTAVRSVANFFRPYFHAPQEPLKSALTGCPPLRLSSKSNPPPPDFQVAGYFLVLHYTGNGKSNVPRRSGHVFSNKTTTRPGGGAAFCNFCLNRPTELTDTLPTE
jgi:hypothetical protein